MGVGVTKRLSAVRWGVATNLLVAWVITIPVSMLMPGLFIIHDIIRSRIIFFNHHCNIAIKFKSLFYFCDFT
jgi:hypothetical protein